MSSEAQGIGNSPAPEEQLKWLIDRISIQDVIARYSLGQDSHQGDDSAILEQWNDTFSDDGMVDFSVAGGPRGTFRELATWMRGDHQNPGSMSSFSNWQHMLSLPNVHIDGDSARARTDFYATHRSRKDNAVATHFNAAGAFVDDLVKTKNGWRIKFRRLELYFADPLLVLNAT